MTEDDGGRRPSRGRTPRRVLASLLLLLFGVVSITYHVYCSSYRLLTAYDAIIAIE